MPGALLLPQPWCWQPPKAAAPGDTGTLRVPQGHHPGLAASCSPVSSPKLLPPPRPRGPGSPSPSPREGFPGKSNSFHSHGPFQDFCLG